MPASSAWFRGEPSPSARVRLFCLPFAGGGASFYRAWGAGLPRWIEVRPIQLPGRESRFNEPAFTSLADVVNQIGDLMWQYLGLPFAVFGHSMGALIGYELARRLEAEQVRVEALLVSGCRAPGLPPRGSPLHQLGTPELRQALRGFAGTSDAVLDDPDFMDLFWPRIRADLQLVETYRYQDSEPLRCPVHAFGGRSDPHVPTDDLAAWASLTHGAFHITLFEGDHFYLKACRKPMWANITDALARSSVPW